MEATDGGLPNAPRVGGLRPPGPRDWLGHLGMGLGVALLRPASRSSNGYDNRELRVTADEESVQEELGEL
jgi:hypothetical protein